MMAVRAGSRSVYACELSGVMVKLSRDVFTANNMSDQVTLLHSLSTKLSVPKDIPKRYGKTHLTSVNNIFADYLWW